MTVSLTRREAVLGWAYLLFQLLFLPSLLSGINALLGTPLDAVWLYFLFFCINFLAVVLLLGRFGLENLRCIRWRGLILTAAAAFLIHWGSTYLVSLLIHQRYPDFYNVNDTSIYTMASRNFWPVAIGTVLLVPVAEELLYRGVFFGSLYCINRVFAYVVSALFFALIHVVSYIGTYPADVLLLCLLQYVPPGLCLAWAYERSGSILCPILVHAAINAIGIFSVR